MLGASENRTLGDFGVMAVQSFFRIRVSSVVEPHAGCASQRPFTRWDTISRCTHACQ